MGAIVLLMASAEGDPVASAIVIAALIVNMALALGLLLIAAQIQKLLGITGLSVISRVIGVLLTALAVQFIFDGVRASNLLGPMT